MKVRVTYVVEKGSPVGLVKHAIEGEIIDADNITIEHGVLCLWKCVPIIVGGPPEAKELVKAYGTGTWRTVIPLVGASDQPTENTDENTPGLGPQKRPIRAP